MTYSRPGTSTVDALERISAPNAPSIIGDSRTSISANGRVIDGRNPGQLARNGEARAAEVTGFIEGLTKVATPIIKDQLTKQAYNQVGELLKTQDPLQLIRSGDETQRQGCTGFCAPVSGDLQRRAHQAIGHPAKHHGITRRQGQS